MQSIFDGIEIGWLKLGKSCCSQIAADGKQMELFWKSFGNNSFSAKLDFGTLNLKIIPFSEGIRICSSLDVEAPIWVYPH